MPSFVRSSAKPSRRSHPDRRRNRQYRPPCIVPLLDRRPNRRNESVYQSDRRIRSPDCLVENGRPVVGVAFQPVGDLLLAASDGEGATISTQGATQSAPLIPVCRRCHPASSRHHGWVHPRISKYSIRWPSKLVRTRRSFPTSVLPFDVSFPQRHR